MKAYLRDGARRSEHVEIDEPCRELCIDDPSGEVIYHFLGFCTDLDPIYSCEPNVIAEILKIENSRVSSGEISANEKAELAWLCEHGLLLKGRRISILSGHISAQAAEPSRNNLTFALSRMYLVPCKGIIIDWFLPQTLLSIPTENISLLVRLERGNLVLIEVGVCKFGIGDFVAGEYTKLKDRTTLSQKPVLARKADSYYGFD